MLANEDECVGEHIKRYSQTPARDAHHELVLFEFLAAVFINAHTGILAGRRIFEACDAGLVIADHAKNLVQLAVHRVESLFHTCLEVPDFSRQVCAQQGHLRAKVSLASVILLLL